MVTSSSDGNEARCSAFGMYIASRSKSTEIEMLRTIRMSSTNGGRGMINIEMIIMTNPANAMSE